LDENNEWIVPSLFSDNYVTLIAADQKKVDISVLHPSLQNGKQNYGFGMECKSADYRN
jgi:hypothetical protein